MANIVWPDSLCPRTFSLKLLADVRATGSVYGGSETVNDLADDTWAVTMEIDSRSGDTGAALEALVNYLQGGIHTAEFGHLARPQTLANFEDVPSQPGAAPDPFLVLNEGTLAFYGALEITTPPSTLTDTSIKGSGRLTMTTAIGQIISAGDMLVVAGLLLQCAETVTATTTTTEVKLVNRLRKSVFMGSIVSFSNPRIRWRLDTASQVSNLVGYTGPVSLSFIEDING